jgi:hypothetical protein
MTAIDCILLVLGSTLLLGNAWKEVFRKHHAVGIAIGAPNEEILLEILYNWPHCKKFYVIPVPDNEVHVERNRTHGQNHTHGLTKLTRKMYVMNETKLEAAIYAVEDMQFDFIYVHVPSSSSNVSQILHMWWGKLKNHGVLAGTTFLTGKNRATSGPAKDAIHAEAAAAHEHHLNPVREFAASYHVSVHHMEQSLHSLYHRWAFAPKVLELPVLIINSTNKDKNQAEEAPHYLIPDLIHVVWLYTGDVEVWVYLHLLSMLVKQPTCLLYVHSFETPIGPFWDILESTGRIRLHFWERNVSIHDIQPIISFHKSDIIRLKALQRFGGIYLDLDVVLARTVDPLRTNKFVLGQTGHQKEICNAVILSTTDSEFLTRWIEEYKNVDFTCLYCHDINVPTDMTIKHPELVALQSHISFFNNHEYNYFSHSKDTEGQGFDYAWVRKDFDGPIYTHHLWGNLNYPKLTTYTFSNYFCDGTEGYARIIQWVFRDTNWRDLHCQFEGGDLSAKALRAI